MSDNNLAWKLVLIAAVVVLMVFFSYPPDEKINLGLDLRGGLHVLLQVDTDSAVKYEMDETVNRVGVALKSSTPPIGYESILPTGNGILEVRGADSSRQNDVRSILDPYRGGWTVQDLGGGNWRLSILAAFRDQVATRSVDTTLMTIRERVDALGVAEPLVQKQGADGDRILIQLPGVEDAERTKDVIGTPAILEWKAVSYPPGAGSPERWVPPESQEEMIAMFGGALPDDTELFPQEFPTTDGQTLRIWWPLKRVSVVKGNDLRNARRDQDEYGSPNIFFELTQEAGRRFEVATRENVGKKMAIVLGAPTGKKVISAPVIQSSIRDRGTIEGGFSIAEADDLALKLRSGAIPVDLHEIEERTVGPSLGRDSIRAGLTAGLAGFLGVMVFMVLYYRLSGINAVVALSLNVLLVFGTLGALPFLFAGAQATLTLPGIAGLILTVGMAVDSNVLIFERIREELRIGKTVRAAVEQGFGKAFWTILDCNVTTLVAAFFLFSYGTGPVKGFALTLTIGLLSSMFTAVFVSRQLFEIYLMRHPRAETLSI